MKTVKVRLDIEIDTDQAVEVRHILAARGIREILLTELRYKFMAIEMAAGSRTGAIQVKLLVADEAASGDPGGYRRGEYCWSVFRKLLCSYPATGIKAQFRAGTYIQ